MLSVRSRSPRIERPVALDDLLPERLAVGGRLLDDEAALGADRDDDGVLHHLRLHQPEDLGAEVLAAVRPADASARHLAAAQVDALGARRVDPDLEQRARAAAGRGRARVELEREVGLRPPRRRRAGSSSSAASPGRAAGSSGGCGPRRGSERRRSPARSAAARLSASASRSPSRAGSKRDAEELDELARRSPRGRRSVSSMYAWLNVLPAWRRYLASARSTATSRQVSPAREDEPVEAVDLDLAAPGLRERVLERLADRVEVDRPVLGRQAEVVDPRVDGPGAVDLVGPLVVHLDAQVLQERQDVGEQDRPAGAQELEDEEVVGGLERPVEGRSRGRPRGRASPCARCRGRPPAA